MLWNFEKSALWRNNIVRCAVHHYNGYKWVFHGDTDGGEEGGQCCTMAYTHAYAHRSTRAHTHNGARLTAAQHNKSDKFMSRSRCGPLSWATQLQRWPVADENRRAKLHRATAETPSFVGLSLSLSILSPGP